MSPQHNGHCVEGSRRNRSRLDSLAQKTADPFYGTISSAHLFTFPPEIFILPFLYVHAAASAASLLAHVLRARVNKSPN